MSNAGSVVLSVSRTAADLYWEELKGKPESFTPSSHNHDERYYTESETASLLSGKVDKETGKGLSANDYTTAEKTKLASAVTKIMAQNGLSSDTSGGEATIELDSAYKSKLDGIEAGADVTDMANVAAAGAVMKSAQTAKTATQTEAVGVDSDGKLWTASGGGGVSDVQVNGESKVASGVANIPIAGYEYVSSQEYPTRLGCVGVEYGQLGGLFITTNSEANTKGALRVRKAQQSEINARTESDYFDMYTTGRNHCWVLVPANLDYAVKAAMTDGVGSAWTDAQRLAALARMGCTVDSNGFVKWTAQA